MMILSPISVHALLRPYAYAVLISRSFTVACLTWWLAIAQIERSWVRAAGCLAFRGNLVGGRSTCRRDGPAVFGLPTKVLPMYGHYSTGEASTLGVLQSGACTWFWRGSCVAGFLCSQPSFESFASAVLSSYDGPFGLAAGAAGNSLGGSLTLLQSDRPGVLIGGSWQNGYALIVEVRNLLSEAGEDIGRASERAAPSLRP